MVEKPVGAVSEDLLVDEMQLILKTLYEKAREGVRPRLGNARGLLKKKLSLDFADYFKFLKRYSYVVIDRNDQTLAVTEEGRSIAEKGADEGFVGELKQHFGPQLQEPEELIEVGEEDALPVADEPPPSEKIVSKKVEPISADLGSKYDSKYTKYDAIGSGGIGTVYKGRHNTLSLDVALKEIKDLFSYFTFLQRTEVARHLKEVVGEMAALNHPLIVKIIDENVEVAYPYFVMEFLPGGNLRELMTKEALPLERCLILFTQICYALRVAHQHGVVHGNLKPENVLIDKQGNVRVTDFGITRLLFSKTDRPIPQVITGSIGYLSPEQMKVRSELTVASDIYSLGILFYETLTGNLPGRRSPLPSQVNKEVPKQIDDLFDKMSHDSPAKRHPDMDAVLSDFYDSFEDRRFLSKGRLILFSDANTTTES